MKKCLLLFYFIGFVPLFQAQSLKAQEPESFFEVSDSIGPEKTTTLFYETRPTKYLTGAVSQISGEEIANVPGVNRITSVAGRMTGISFITVDGLPGIENADFRIRGTHTFGGSRGVITLIDGRMDDASRLDPYDIESIVFLKDAVSLAWFGLRSGNGVILIHTKRAKEGRIVVDVNTTTSFSQSTRLPKYLDSYLYAQLYNEAQLNDDPNSTPLYDVAALEAYRTGSDPYRYPNVNWTDEFLKKNYLMNRANINVSGGTKTARYYVSLNHSYNSGAFKVDEDVNTYNTNSDINVMSIHGNLQLNIGKNLMLDFDVRGKKEKRNMPGGYDSDIGGLLINYMFSRPFNVHPIKNEDGSIAGTNNYQNNIYGVLNHTGYSIFERSSISQYVSFSYDLGDLLQGLSITGRAGFNYYGDYSISRTKNFAVYELNPEGSEETYNQFGQDTKLGNSGAWRSIYRNYDHFIGLKYTREFGKHYVNALAIFDRQQVMNANSSAMTSNYQGPKGSLSYRYNNTYLFDFVMAYQGSEQYEKGKRYGAFPAAGIGWILSNESFMENINFVDFLKIRATYGQTGMHSADGFRFMSSFGGTGTVYQLGAGSPAGVSGYAQTQIANPLLTWEKCVKTNLGVDFAFIDGRLDGSFDYFTEKTRDILVNNSFTAMYGNGSATISIPVGKFENKGYEFQLGWSDRIGSLSYYVRGNYSYAENKIVYQDEIDRDYPWQVRTGLPVGTIFGYVFDRFFTEDDDISQLPNQVNVGTQQIPGDIKYKDLNGDNVINTDDVKAIGNNNLPTASYGFGCGIQYKGFDVNVVFHGASGATKYLSGVTYNDFQSRTGNVMEHHLDRWRPGDGQSASYPRLTIDNNNNYATSDFWRRDNSFLRLKYVEIGYTIPVKISQKVGMSKARIFVNGNNLYVWDKIGIMDPEMLDSGLGFPIQRTFSAGVNISF